MLEFIWFILWGLLWAIYLVLDGYDFGIGMLLPFLGRNNDERRLMINSMGPFWDGNEVWLITAGGVTFAAFPRAYAIMFSALYIPLMLLLFALILRGVSFEFRAKIDSPSWRKVWDTSMFIGSAAPAFLLGVFFANLFAGIPIDAQGVNQGRFLDLLSPYALFGGLVFMQLFLVHGALFLAFKTQGELHDRAVLTARRIWPIALISVGVFLMMSTYRTNLFFNYLNHPVLFLILVAAVAGLVMTRVFIARGAIIPAFGASSLSIGAIAMFGIGGLFPAILLSSLNPMYNVTAFNSASSQLTLTIMLGVAGVMVPIVIAYQTWVHIRFGHKLKLEDLESGHSY